MNQQTHLHPEVQDLHSDQEIQKDLRDLRVRMVQFHPEVLLVQFHHVVPVNHRYRDYQSPHVDQSDQLDPLFLTLHALLLDHWVHRVQLVQTGPVTLTLLWVQMVQRDQKDLK